MIWLLDTNVVSEVWKPQPEPRVLAWLEDNQEECALSEITFGELHYAISDISLSWLRSTHSWGEGRGTADLARSWKKEADHEPLF